MQGSVNSIEDAPDVVHVLERVNEQRHVVARVALEVFDGLFAKIERGVALLGLADHRRAEVDAETLARSERRKHVAAPAARRPGSFVPAARASGTTA